MRNACTSRLRSWPRREAGHRSRRCGNARRGYTAEIQAAPAGSFWGHWASCSHVICHVIQHTLSSPVFFQASRFPSCLASLAQGNAGTFRSPHQERIWGTKTDRYLNASQVGGTGRKVRTERSRPTWRRFDAQFSTGRCPFHVAAIFAGTYARGPPSTPVCSPFLASYPPIRSALVHTSVVRFTCERERSGACRVSCFAGYEKKKLPTSIEIATF